MFRLLFSQGSHEMPPTEVFITAYDTVLGSVLKHDGIMYYTEDSDVMQYRKELYRELLSNQKLLDALVDFTEKYVLPDTKTDTGSQLLAGLVTYRANVVAVQELNSFLASQSLQSEAMNELRKHITEITNTEKWHHAIETFEKIPDDLLKIKSITLGVNLDSNGNAHEAGIAALNPYYFVSNHPLEKLLRLGDKIHTTEPLLRPDREKADLYFDLNRELMRAIDRVIVKELKKLHVDYGALFNDDIGFNETLLREVVFLTESADLLSDLQACSVKLRFIRNDDIKDTEYAVDIPKTVEKYKLGYAEPVVDKEGLSEKVMAFLGMPIPYVGKTNIFQGSGQIPLLDTSTGSEA